RATWSDTPSISNSTRPGLMRHTHTSGAPLPLPMRTSIGFFDTGTSGKMRIHTRPARFMWRGMAGGAPPVLPAGWGSGSIGLQSELPEGERVAGRRHTVDAALVGFAELGSVRLQHGSVLSFQRNAAITQRRGADGRRRLPPSSCPAPSGRAPRSRP